MTPETRRLEVLVEALQNCRQRHLTAMEAAVAAATKTNDALNALLAFTAAPGNLTAVREDPCNGWSLTLLERVGLLPKSGR